jgi:Rieske Fe-S protein
MDRKKFIHSCCFTGLALSSISLLESCSSAIYTAKHNLSGGKISVDESEFTIMTKKGPRFRKFVLVRNETLQFPVYLNRLGEHQYRAVYLKCTHKGCEVRPQGTILVCPCHSSEFDVNGKVFSPPADEDLKQFPVSVEENKIIISAS